MPGGSKNAFINPRTGKIIISDAGKGNKEWRKVVALKARSHMAYLGSKPLDRAAELHLQFIQERPKSHYRTGKNADKLKDDAPKLPISKPDCLKLARAVEDALTGIMYVDDCLVVSGSQSKRYGEIAGVMITVKEPTE